MCKSAGAPIAQREARQLNIVPANKKVFKTLKKALSEHKKSLQDDNKRACVMIKGDVLHFKSAVVRENGQNITGTLQPQVFKEYYLVNEAELLDSKTALADS